MVSYFSSGDPFTSSQGRLAWMYPFPMREMLRMCLRPSRILKVCTIYFTMCVLSHIQYVVEYYTLRWYSHKLPRCTEWTTCMCKYHLNISSQKNWQAVFVLSTTISCLRIRPREIYSVLKYTQYLISLCMAFRKENTPNLEYIKITKFTT